MFAFFSQRQISENTLIITHFYKRKTVNRVGNYFEITIPQYEPDDFRSHYRPLMFWHKRFRNATNTTKRKALLSIQ